MRFEHSIAIPAPRGLVWRLANNPRLRPQWDVRVAEYVVEDADGGACAPAAGALAGITWRTPVLSASADAEYIHVDAPRCAVLRIAPAGLPLFPPGLLTWRFEDENDDTRLTVRFESETIPDEKEPGFLVRALTRFLMKRDTHRSLGNLRRLVLEHARSATPETEPLLMHGSEPAA